MSDWTCNSNEALTLSMVRAPEDEEALAKSEAFVNFHPAFTYPIYGEDEKIYGYNDLIIDLKFASGSLKHYVSIKYSEKLDAASTVDDVEEILSQFLPEGYFTDESEFLETVQEDATNFRPAGQLVHSYTRPSALVLEEGKGKGKTDGQVLDSESEDAIVYEVYHTTWDTPGFRDYHKLMQIFILLYIEGGSYINEEENSWEFMVLYEKRKRRTAPFTPTYHFAGYTSLYPFYHFPEKVRLRLSQFVILPPYQRARHGSELYRAIYQYILSQPSIAELTVEDPAEAFEDLRDKNDLQMLFVNEQFLEEGFGTGTLSHGGGRVGGVGKAGRSGRGGAGLAAKGKLGPPADKAWVEKWRRDLKIAGFQRLIEMIVLSRLDPGDVRALRAYRLQVKERLYRFNFEVLMQLEKEERHEKLEETFQSVQEDYNRILALAR